MDKPLIKHFTRLVVPFVTDQALIHEGIWEAKHFTTDNSLLLHIRKLVGSSVTSVCRYYVLNNNVRMKWFHPQRPVFYQKKDEIFAFSFEQIHLFLFETKIGFLIMDICYRDSPTMEELIWRNYTLKKFNQHDQQSMWREHKKNKDGPVELVHVSFQHWIEMLTSDFKVTAYFEEENGSPSMANTFTFALLPPREDEFVEEKLFEALFHLRHSFGEHHIPSKREINRLQRTETQHFFKNSYWGFSLEGAANLVFLTGHAKADSFFERHYPASVKNSYFILFLIALHQRCTLMHLAQRAARISKLERNQITQIFQTIEEIDEVQHDIIQFTLRSSFLEVSNMTHKALLYDSIFHSLRIQNLREELHFELDSLQRYSQLKRQELQEKEKEEASKKERSFEQKRQSLERIILGLSTLFVVVSTIADFWTILDKLFAGAFAGQVMASIYLIPVVLILLIVSSTVGYYLFYTSGRRRG